MHFTYDCCRVVNACKVMQQDHEQGSARQHISCFLWSCAFSCFFAKEHRLAHLASFFFFFFGTFGYTYTIENVYSILHSVTVHMVTGAEWHASVAFHVKFLLVQWRCFEFASSNTEKKKATSQRLFYSCFLVQVVVIRGIFMLQSIMVWAKVRTRIPWFFACCLLFLARLL